MEPLWPKARLQLQKLELLYQQMLKKPEDAKLVRKNLTAMGKMYDIQIWYDKCLEPSVAQELLPKWRQIVKLLKDKTSDNTAAMVEVAGELENGLQYALDGTAPERFTYSGFTVLNPERFSDVWCRQILAGVDFLHGLFRKRGCEAILDNSIKEIVLQIEAEAYAYFHAGTHQLVIAVPKMLKGGAARMHNEFLEETFLHEFGHYVHRVYITGEAREAWDAPWGDLKHPRDPSGPNISLQERAKRLDPLEIVTDYGKTDKYEDFAETFVAFMIAPQSLTPTAKYRMQRALSLSGLYGRAVVKLARIVSRFLTPKYS